MLEGRCYTVYTDHKPLTRVLESKTERSPRQIRQLEYISQFTNGIQYVRGTFNVVADTLSNLNLQLLCAEQQKDDNLAEITRNKEKYHNLKLIEIPLFNVNVWCEVSQGTPRPYVPLAMRRIIFDKMHSVSHPGVRGTRRMICKRYYWPGMSKEINVWAKECISCQKSKITSHTKSSVTKIDIPKGRFEHIHVDIVGPLPPSRNHRYLLTVIDRFTRWPEAIR